MSSHGKDLVIMAKALRIGQVKSRLAQDIGAVAAWSFQRRMLSDVARRLIRDRRWRTWLGVSPDHTRHEPSIWPVQCPRIGQGSGDLGSRMKRVMCELVPGPVVLIGADIPEIEARYIHMAFELLGHSDAVFGPANDGGYWLIGLKRPSPFCQIFKGVRWSSSYALSDTLNNLPKSWRIGFVTKLSDVDEVEDLKKLQGKKR